LEVHLSEIGHQPEQLWWYHDSEKSQVLKLVKLVCPAVPLLPSMPSLSLGFFHCTTHILIIIQHVFEDQMKCVLTL
jgi:hypothetical protein